MPFLDDLIGQDKSQEFPFNGLTVEQELFCYIYALSGDRLKAVRTAFREEMTDSSCWSKAYYLLKRECIKTRIHSISNSLVKAEAAQMVVSLKEHCDMLAMIRDEARDNGAFGAAVTAEVSRGKASGLYATRIEVTATKAVDEMSLEEIDAQLSQLSITNSAFSGENVLDCANATDVEWEEVR